MMDQHQTALISLLLGSFPAFQSGDGEAALAAYEIVLGSSDERDWQPGVMLLINRQVPEHDGRFAPTAPQLAVAIRQARDQRLRREQLSCKPALPPPDIEHSPESRERVRAMTERLVGNLGAAARTEDAARDKREKERIERETRWLRDRGDLVELKGAAYPISHALAKQLGIGDPEGDREVA